MKLLRFFRAIDEASSSVPDSAYQEGKAIAFGGPAHVCEKAQAISESLKSAKTLSETDARRWVEYWQRQKFLRI